MKKWLPPSRQAPLQGVWEELNLWSVVKPSFHDAEFRDVPFPIEITYIWPSLQEGASCVRAQQSTRYTFVSGYTQRIFECFWCELQARLVKKIYIQYLWSVRLTYYDNWNSCKPRWYHCSILNLKVNSFVVLLVTEHIARKIRILTATKNLTSTNSILTALIFLFLFPIQFFFYPAGSSQYWAP